MSVAAEQIDTKELERFCRVIRDSDWLGTAVDDVIETLAENAFERSAKADEVIFTIGQYDGSEVILIESGTFQLTTLSAQTGEMMLSDINTGNVVGLDIVLANMGDEAGKLGLTAKSPGKILMIDSQSIKDLVTKKPAFARSLLELLASRLVAWRSGSMAKEDPSGRVYRYLFEMLERDDQNPDQWMIAHMPKHRELAESAGVSETDAAEAVAALIRNNVAKRNYPGMIVLDYASFATLAR